MLFGFAKSLWLVKEFPPSRTNRPCYSTPMHRPRSFSVVFKLWWAAFLWFLLLLLIPTALALTTWLVFSGDLAYSWPVIISCGSILVVTLLQWMVASGARCPLCMMPSLSRKGCARNKRAAKLFGSYRTPAVLGILFRGHFRCPYCNEPVKMRARQQVKEKK